MNIVNANKVRESNYELLRIFAMFFIVLHHLITKGELLTYTEETTCFFLRSVLLFGLVHVNCFMLITGYYQSKSKFHMKKLLSLLLQIGFYNFIINTILYYTGVVKYTNVEYLKSISFYNLSSYWYVQCYFIVYLLSPFFNKFIDFIDRKTFKKLVLVLLLCFVIIPFVSRGLLYDTGGVYSLTIYNVLFCRCIYPKI